MPKDTQPVNSSESTPTPVKRTRATTKPTPEPVVAREQASPIQEATAALVVAKSQCFDSYVALERAKQMYDNALNEVVARERVVMKVNSETNAATA